MEKNVDDEWQDDDFGQEYAKFSPADQIDSVLYDDTVEVLYIEPNYDSIKPYINQWNKKRKKIDVGIIRRCINTPFKSDNIANESGVCLDMGARLYNAIRMIIKEKPKYLKILKISNPKDKFDVQYYASEYKLIGQQKIAPKKKTTKK